MKIAALSVSGLVLVAIGFAAAWLSGTCPRGYVCTFQTNTDLSPIIITDGSSIHFAQKDLWAWENPRQLSALLPGHHTHRVKVGICTVTAGTSAVSSCDPSMIDYQKLTGKSWKLFLCAGSPCPDDPNAGTKNTVTTLSLDKNGTWGGDQGSDVQVISNDNGGDFASENNSADGASIYLANPRLLYATLQVTENNNSTTTQNADCHTSNPPSRPCVVYVCYAGDPNKCQ